MPSPIPLLLPLLSLLLILLSIIPLLTISTENSNNDENNDHIQQLQQWLKSYNAIIPDVIIKSDQYGFRSTHAANDINEGTIILSIPEHLLITEIFALKESKYAKLVMNNSKLKKSLSTTDCLSIILYILEQLSLPSFFTPYFNTFPQDLSNFVEYWDTNTDDNSTTIFNTTTSLPSSAATITIKPELVKKRLHGSFMLSRIVKQIEGRRNDYDTLSAALPGFQQQFPFKEFLRVSILVDSRVFSDYVKDDDNDAGTGDEIGLLCPFADMFNHDPVPNILWGYHQQSKTFQMRAERDIKKGDPITTSYGTNTNGELLLYWGFALDPGMNRDGKMNENTIRLEFPTFHLVVDGDREQQQEQQNCNQFNNLDKKENTINQADTCTTSTLNKSPKKKKFEISTYIDDGKRAGSSAVPALDYIHRFLLGTSKHVETNDEIKHIQWIRLKNQVLKHLIMADSARDALLKYSSTLQENLNHHALTSQYSNERNALNVLIGEQEVGEFWLKIYSIINYIGQQFNHENGLNRASLLRMRDVWKYLEIFAGEMVKGIDDELGRV
jgi:hypothetical protein